MPRPHLTKLGVTVPPRAPRDEGHEHAYPRPMLRRGPWTSLNGRWDFAIDAEGNFRSPDEVQFDRTIEVPYAPETARSGIGDNGLYKACWYRRSIDVPELDPDERLILHFGAVDYEATVWIDGTIAVRHEGGYTPFSADISRLLRPGTKHQIVVLAEDDPHDLAKPRGKQDWQLVPHSIWYPRTTGIWQTVWLERVKSTYIGSLRWTPYLATWEIGLNAQIHCAPNDRLWLVVRLYIDDILVAEDRYTVVHEEVNRRIALSDPGIDDFRNELLWSPAKPTLIDVELELVDAQGTVRDAVRSYTALRSFSCDGGRFILNGRPYPLRLVLDQGYWPDTGMTAPDDAALRRDVELIKAMGFNGARKHQKIEDPRYLYWADRLGLLVWGEMPSAYRFTHKSIERLTRQWIEALRRDISHPCIVAWVPFNESWGVPNLPDNKPERHYVEALYHFTKTIDPTRPVVGNDGWESLATDILGIHDYDAVPERLSRRYATPELLPRILKHERPGGRALVIEGKTLTELPVVLSEFGGIAVAPEVTTYGNAAGTSTWGYSSTVDTGELGHRYRRLLECVRSLELLAGFCYTQLTDTYQEANGLLYADRRPKFPLAEIAAATTGEAQAHEAPPVAFTGIALTERGGAP